MTRLNDRDLDPTIRAQLPDPEDLPDCIADDARIALASGVGFLETRTGGWWSRIDGSQVLFRTFREASAAALAFLRTEACYEPCECGDHGYFASLEDDIGLAVIERCDLCERYPDDWFATIAHQDALRTGCKYAIAHAILVLENFPLETEQLEALQRCES